MSRPFRPEWTRRFLHWLDGERWCATCQSWTPLAHDPSHPPLPEGARPRPHRRYDDTRPKISRRPSAR